MSVLRLFDGTKLCDLLGLDANVTKSITLEFGVGVLPTATVVQVVPGDEQDELVELLRTFQMYEVIDEEEQTG